MSSTFAGWLLLGAIAVTGCAGPGAVCQTDCSTRGLFAGHHGPAKVTRPLLRHRKGAGWSTHVADFGYNRTYWQRFPGDSMHALLPWAEEIPKAEGKTLKSKLEPVPRDDPSSRGDMDSFPSPSDQLEQDPEGLDRLPDSPDLPDLDQSDVPDSDDPDDKSDILPSLPTSASISDDGEGELLSGQAAPGQRGLVHDEFAREDFPRQHIIRADDAEEAIVRRWQDIPVSPNNVAREVSTGVSGRVLPVGTSTLGLASEPMVDRGPSLGIVRRVPEPQPPVTTQAPAPSPPQRTRFASPQPSESNVPAAGLIRRLLGH